MDSNLAFNLNTPSYFQPISNNPSVKSKPFVKPSEAKSSPQKTFHEKVHQNEENISSEKTILQRKRKFEENPRLNESGLTVHTYFSRNKTSSLFKNNPDIPKIPIIESEEPTTSNDLFSEHSFEKLGFHLKLMKAIELFEFSKMTTVQERAIPAIMKRRDVLVKSHTGSGKTLAYALPIFQKLMSIQPPVKRGDGTLALIIVPSRELAMQTQLFIDTLRRRVPFIVSGCIAGGNKLHSEKLALRAGLSVLVATPGRLLYHIDNTASFNTSSLRVLVLDEVDRMCEVGCELKIKRIIKHLNAEKRTHELQTVFLSATLPKGIDDLIGIALKRPQVVDVTTDDATAVLIDGKLATPHNLTHYFLFVPLKLRLVALIAFIIAKCKFSDEKKMAVFMGTPDMAEFYSAVVSKVLSKVLNNVSSSEAKTARPGEDAEGDDEEGDDEEGDEIDDDSDQEFSADVLCVQRLHSKLNDLERKEVFNNFRKAKSGVLFCTDVAARGLDWPNVNWIVQFTPAIDPNDYVHRVGRTARADRKGSTVAFLSPHESPYVTQLQLKGINFNEMRINQLLNVLMQNELWNKKMEKLPSTMEIAATRFQDKCEFLLANDKELYKIGVAAYHSYARFMARLPSSARAVLQPQMIHQGHVAKSFCLNETPKQLGMIAMQMALPTDREERRRREAKGINSFAPVGIHVNDLKKSANNIPLGNQKKIFKPTSEFESGW